MSHFCGLVILTPNYSLENGMDDSLAKYDESKKFPEYCKCNVSDADIVEFLTWYIYGSKATPESREDYLNFKKSFVKFMRGKKGFFTKKQFDIDFPHNKGDKAYINHLIYKNNDRYAEYFKAHKPDVFAQFTELYKAKGDDWNGNRWRKDGKGVWQEFSTYNPNSKWDWYCVGGRWDNCIKTKSDEFVNECLFGEIDFEPYSEDCYEEGKDWLGNPCKQLKEGYKYHYSKDDFPFCVIIDGVWYERGKMGWFACVSNEKSKTEWGNEIEKLLEKIPADAEVYSVDFHI
jgi:hypothetical protein